MATIENLDHTASPALLFDADAIEHNLDLMLMEVGNDPSLLRPHIKTHKCRKILDLHLDREIKQVKCATIAEAECAAQAGIPDVLLSYPIIGPNIERFAELARKYQDTFFSCLVDDPGTLDSIENSGHTFTLLLDLDCGMHRTGIGPGKAAIEMIQSIEKSSNLTFGGIHAYDGHIHDAPISIRQARFDEAIKIVDDFIESLVEAGVDVPLVVSGGSPTFPMHATRAKSSSLNWQASPGTPVLWDAGYGEHYPEMGYAPAALLLTRVISKPVSGHISIDLGHKSVSAENPIENRVRFPELSELEFVSQSEEHLVIRCAEADSLPVGYPLIGIPYHVCPSVALHNEAAIVRNKNVTDERWSITARGRKLTV